MSQWIFTSDGNYVNFNGGGNLWRLHKDSNCISWHWDESGDLFFDVYDAEFTVKAGNIADVVIDGVPLSAASGFPTAIRAVFTGLSSGGSSYLVLTDYLTQSGTSNPVAVSLADTIGSGGWVRDFEGVYTNLTTKDISDLNKVRVEGARWYSDITFTYSSFPLYTANSYLDVSFDISFSIVGGKLKIQLQIWTTASANIELSTALAGSNLQFLALPEIQVYP